MIRSQTFQLLLKKGPRAPKGKPPTHSSKRGEEDEMSQTNEDEAGFERDDHGIDRRYKAKTNVEKKVMASIFHLLWPPEVYGRNPITLHVRTVSKTRKAVSDSELLSQRFGPIE